MPQLHFYVDKTTDARLKEKAKSSGTSVSKYIAQIVKKELDGKWPDGYLESVIGGWQGEPLERPEQGAYEQRDAWGH